MSSGSSKVLRHKVNTYNSVEVTDACSWAGITHKEVTVPSTGPREFEARLWESLRVWKREGRKGVWLKIGIGAADLVPVAVAAGFQFHHVEPEYLMMTAWLAQDMENKLPPGPAHFIGVAGFVLNSKGEVLCIREKSGPSARLKDFWKLPGGLVDQHEDMHEAVVREVREETGLETRFKSIATIQEIHHSGEAGGPARTGTSDLYIMCVLEAVDENQDLVPQESEIAACKWVPLEDLLNLRYYASENTVYYGMFRTAVQVAQGIVDGLDCAHLDFGIVPGSNTVYGASLHRNLTKTSKL